MDLYSINQNPEDTDGFNEHCHRVGITRKPECRLSDDGGNYQVLSLREFIRIRREQGRDTETVEKEDGQEYLVLYRGIIDFEGYTKDPRKTVKTYREFMDQNAKGDHGWNPKPISKEWGGHVPGIGTNTAFTLEGATNYLLVNKVAATNNYSLYDSSGMERPSIIRKYHLPVNDDVRVLVVPKECQSQQISCDQHAAETYDATYLDNYDELNLTYSGVRKTKFIEVNRVYIDWDIEPTPIENTLLFRKKYLKYKQKYLELKKLLNK